MNIEPQCRVLQGSFVGPGTTLLLDEGNHQFHLGAQEHHGRKEIKTLNLLRIDMSRFSLIKSDDANKNLLVGRNTQGSHGGNPPHTHTPLYVEGYLH